MTSSRDRATRRTRLALAVSALCLVGLGAAACGGSGGSQDSQDSASSPGSLTDAVHGAAPSPVKAAAPGRAESARDPDDPDTSLDTQPAIISTGNVQLKSDDVGKARFDVTGVIDPVNGTVSDETSDADDDGSLLRTHLVLRVPAASFSAVMDTLAKLSGTRLVNSTRSSEDVTTQVIDNAVRVKTQRASIDRIRLLLDRATNVREIISIESELTRRQTDLDSLERRQAYLADQTAQSTITVSIERTPKHEAPPADTASHHHGFLAGLHAGWSGLSAATVGVLTAGGLLLPFALVIVIVGVPTWVAVRRRRRPTQPA